MSKFDEKSIKEELNNIISKGFCEAAKGKGNNILIGNNEFKIIGNYLTKDKSDEIYSKCKDKFRWSGDLGGVHPLCFIVERLQYHFSQLVGVITFKRNGVGMLNQLQLKDTDGNNVVLPCLTVMTVGNVVWDFTLGYYGYTVKEYIELLYSMGNPIIRVDYIISRFMSYERKDIDDMLTLEHCKYLRTREGLSQEKFEQIESKLKDIKAK